MNTMTSTPLRTLVAGAILSSLALGFATVSCADERATSPQLIVKFGDLDVSTSKGAAALYGRIHNAAFNVCWRMYDHDNLAYRLNKDACLQKVIADAVTKVNQPALSAVFASKYGLSAPLVLAAAAAHSSGLPDGQRRARHDGLRCSMQDFPVEDRPIS
jgi:UrcA family protein